MTMWLVLFASLMAAQTDAGPIPAKTDLPYLLHADSLVSTEVAEAKQTEQKDGTLFTIAGANSPVKTPLASPIFVIHSDKLPAEKLQLFPLESKGRQREITFYRKKKNPESYTFTIKSLGNNVYRLEVNESLPNGEYSISPADSNLAFCFAVY
jgi:hypothetical protein